MRKLMTRLAAISALALLAGAAQAAEPKVDATLRSTPKTVVRGYISRDTPPVLRIKSGQTVRIDTVSHGGMGDDPVKVFGEVGIPPDQVLQDVKDIYAASKTEGWGGHVLTGPIFVEGAEPGDMLEVRIIKLENRVPYGVNNPGPGGVAPGVLTDRHTKVVKFDMKRKVALFTKDIEIPLGNFMGIMAVAPGPDIPKIASKPPGPHGGNMDFNRLIEGSTLYLPVFNTGALFVTGDSHALQGDGEVSGNAVEASLTATLQFIVHKGEGKAMRWPWAEDANNFYVMGMDLDLDVAMKNAVLESIAFLEKKKGLSKVDAYSLSSIAVDFGVAEAVDENLLIYGRIGKNWFKTKTPYWSAK